MNDQQYRLFAEKGPEPGKFYALTSVSMTIGRDPMVEISINDPEVSRRHARLIGTISGYRIQDLGSTNGTFVDGVRLGGEPLDLEFGQVISIGGGVALVFQSAVDDDPQAVTMVDTSMASLDTLGLMDKAYEVGSEPVSDEPSLSTEDSLESDAIDNGEIDLVAEEERYDPSIVESAAPVTILESIQQEEAPSADQSDPASDEAQDLSEPVIVPYQSEPAETSATSKNNSSRRTSTIVAALALLLICCCCSFILFLYYFGGDWMLRQMGLLQ